MRIDELVSGYSAAGLMNTRKSLCTQFSSTPGMSTSLLLGVEISLPGKSQVALIMIEAKYLFLTN